MRPTRPFHDMDRGLRPEFGIDRRYSVDPGGMRQLKIRNERIAGMSREGQQLALKAASAQGRDDRRRRCRNFDRIPASLVRNDRLLVISIRSSR